MFSFQNKRSFSKELVLPNFLFRFTVVSLALLATFFIGTGVVRAADPAPEIYQVLPDKGDIAGGDSVVVKGANFQNGAIYKLGNGGWVAATFFNVNTLVVTTTASSVGLATLSIENPDGQVDAENIFTFTDGPMINFVGPYKGRTTGGDTIKIYCDNIPEDTAKLEVRVDGQLITETIGKTSSGESGLGDYIVRVVVPAHAVGYVNVELKDLNTNKSDTETDAFLYSAPEIFSVNPSVISPAKDNVTMKIEADYIDSAVQAQIKDTVTYDCQGESLSGDFITCVFNVAGAPSGRYDLILKMTDGTEGVMTNAIRIGEDAVVAMSIDSISPNKGPQAGGTEVTITGESLGGSNAEVTFGTLSVTNFSLRTDTELRFMVPVSGTTGFVDVKVLNTSTPEYVTLTDGFEYLAGAGPAVEGCFELMGEGQYVSLNGVNNSGKLHFEDNAYLPDPLYRACAIDPDGDAVPPFELRGWAWDDNLGWVSMYCKDGTNLSVGCGGQDYTVTVDADGKFTGHAWGDNVGWISFNNPGFSQLLVNTDEQVCQGYIYGVTKPGDFPAQSGCANHSENDVYAWSDNVGWLNLDGVVMPWYELTKKIKEESIKVQIPMHPKSIIAGNEPYANGVDKYEISVETKDIDGNILDPDRYEVHARPIWIKDSVKYDQIDSNNTVDNLNCGNFGGAVTKPCVDLPNTDPGVYSAPITALAPTSNMNFSEFVKGGITEYFNNETFIAPLNSPKVESNDLILKGLRVYILDKAYPVGREERCVFPGPSMDCEGNARLFTKLRDLSDITYESPHIFKFQPIVKVSQVDDVKKTDYMALQRDIINEVKLKIECASLKQGSTTACDNQVKFDSGLSSGFELVYDSNDDGEFDLGTDTVGQFTLENNFIGSINVAALCPPPGTCSAYASNPYIYSLVDYMAGSKEVKYFSNKLPRIRGSLVVNPVAEVRGNVYSTGVVSLQEGKEIRSLGEVSTNILRNTIFRNVSALIAGAQVVTGGGTVEGKVIGVDKYLDIKPGSAGGVKSLPDSNGYSQVLYFKGGDVTIGDGTTVEWDGERTVIVEGGNVFIDNDLYNGANSNAKLGLIVLKDFTKAGANQGGNIYIKNTVTNIQANIFADGAVMSYSDVVTASATVKGKQYFNLPAFNNEDDRFSKLTNQLFIEGSIASENSIGGANASPPILGDGTQVGAGEGVYGSAPTDRSLARLFDLNFLRYYGLALDLDHITKEPIDQQCLLSGGDGSGLDPDANCYNIQLTAYDPADPENSGDLLPMDELSSQYTAEKALGLPDKSYSPVYIFFDPPTATLPGFSTAENVDVEIKAQ